MVEASIRAAFLAACKLDVAALKPGNVHRHADGHGMTVADFIASAEAAAPALCRPGSPLGRRLLDAVTATRAAVGCNTNLGILLLCAPLAVAAESGIAVAAALRDRIAQCYADGFADLFGFALPLLQSRLEAGDDLEAAMTVLYLSILARWPDSHLVRKFGDSAAQSVTRAAAAILGRWRAASTAPARHGLLLDWDKSLKTQGFNPGTSADLTVATLFAQGLARAEARLA